jgi:hypothetical protein
MKFLKRRKPAPPLEFLPAAPLESLAWLELIEIVRQAAAHGHEIENQEKAVEAIRQVVVELSRRSHRLWLTELEQYDHEYEVQRLRWEIEDLDARIARLLGEPRGWRFGPGCCGPYGHWLRRWKEERE